MKIVILGAGGRLGAALVREFRPKYDLAGLNHAQLNLTSLDDVRGKLGAMNFDVLINAAAFTNVDACETERDRAFLINAEAPGVLTEICNAKGAKLIHFIPITFSTGRNARHTQKRIKRIRSVLTANRSWPEKTTCLHLKMGISLCACPGVFGPDRPSFIDAMIERAQEDEKMDAVSDKFSTPTYTHDIARTLPRFFDRGVAVGILHFANAGKRSWQQYAQWALDSSRDAGIPLKAKTVGALKLSDMKNWVARRPVYSVLCTAKYTDLTGMAPRAWREAVADYITRFYSKK